MNKHYSVIYSFSPCVAYGSLYCDIWACIKLNDSVYKTVSQLGVKLAFLLQNILKFQLENKEHRSISVLLPYIVYII